MNIRRYGKNNLEKITKSMHFMSNQFDVLNNRIYSVLNLQKT